MSNSVNIPRTCAKTMIDLHKILPKNCVIKILQYLKCKDLSQVQRADPLFDEIVARHKHEVLKFERKYKAVLNLWENTDDSHYFMVQLHSECGCKVRRRNIIYFMVGDKDDNDRDTIYNCQNTHAAKIIPKSYIDETFLRFDSETNEIDEDAAEDALFDDYFSGRYADWELREAQQQKTIQEARHYGEEITLTGLTLRYDTMDEARKGLDKFFATLHLAAPNITELIIEGIDDRNWSLSKDSLAYLNFPYKIPLDLQICSLKTTPVNQFFAWKQFEKYELDILRVSGVGKEFFKHKMVKEIPSILFGAEIHLTAEIVKQLASEYIGYEHTFYDQGRLSIEDVVQVLKYIHDSDMDFDTWQLPIEEDLPFHEAALRVPGVFRNLPQKILWELDNRVVCIKVNHGELELINDRDDWTDDTQSDDSDTRDPTGLTDDEDGW
ncbi:hypothetical protein WR25_07023 [Diploscapter pachys]|uniref:F-box domain-containing protein n=1 Tax=Diploscapter pachys TaxID=2018661 RepID=A0A2A2JRN5_9BILA|nr:hypothetical protein WR25_07023 [Diploscapter pachys]